MSRLLLGAVQAAGSAGSTPGSARYLDEDIADMFITEDGDPLIQED